MISNGIRRIQIAARCLKYEGVKQFGKMCLGPLLQSSHEHCDEIHIVADVLEAEKRPGVMVDVGAHRGGSLAPFARAGWQVHAFEPDKANRRILKSRVGRYPSLVINEQAVTEETKGRVPLYTSQVSSGISSLTAFHEDHAVTDHVDVVALRDYVASSKIDEIDFLKIDAEGFDQSVLLGLLAENASGSQFVVRPRAVVCEFEDRKTVPLGYTYHDLAALLQGQGYQVAVSEWHPIQAYGTRHRWNRFFVYPGELQNSSAWGNLIAMRDDDAFERLLKVTDLSRPENLPAPSTKPGALRNAG